MSQNLNLTEIIDTIEGINKQIEYLDYLCRQSKISTIDLDTAHYALNQKLKPEVEDKIQKLKEHKDV